MPEMQFEWEGLIRLLAQNLYSEKRIFIRELIQNAHDAILRRQAVEPEIGGRIDVEADLKNATLSVHDNGIGMDEYDIQTFLATIGTGATRIQQDVPGLIGYFGIGFLSAFIVAEKVVVLTRKINSDLGWRWENTGSRAYTLQPEPIKSPGTTVLVYLKETETGLLHEDEIVDVIRTYADMLRIPIYVNRKPQPSNAISMPWERDDYDSARLQIEGRLYINEATGDDALEIIPIRHRFTSGILYITRTRVFGVNPPRAVRVFLKRMFVSPNIAELLPPWASFVNGIVNSDKLLPTAARDNIVRDDVFQETNRVLGNLIVDHLDELRRSNPDRFTRIQEYHSVALRAACAYYEPFFTKFIDLLEWRTTPDFDEEMKTAPDVKRVTLPQVIEALKQQQAGAKVIALRCFGAGTTSSQFLRLAAASQVTVIDAGGPYEMGLLIKYVESMSPRKIPIKLVRVDREDDPVLFKSLGPEELPAVSALADSLQHKLAVQRFGDRRLDITVTARSFEPSSIPALIRPGEGAESFDQAQAVLEDPDSSLGYRTLAEERVRKGQDLAITLNANNMLVRKIAIATLDDSDGARLAMGIYNSAFLSSGMMSEHNASVLHDNLTYFIDRSLDGQNEIKKLKALNQSTTAELMRLTKVVPRTDDKPSPGVVTAFVMVPFDTKYRELIAALRDVVEDRWFLQLFLASDRKYEDRILDSVRTHIERADIFIAEIGEANPNVMFELGAVFASRKGRPAVTLVDREGGYSDHRLPADLGSLIYVNYSPAKGKGLKEFADYLESEMQKDTQVRDLVTKQKDYRYLSPKRLTDYLGGSMTSKVCEALSLSFPAESRWLTLTELELKSVLNQYGLGDAAPFILKRIVSRLSQE